MQVITNDAGFEGLHDNLVLGQRPILNNTRIEFAGTGNILYCEEGVRLGGSTIKFAGNDSLVVLQKSSHIYHLDLTVYNNSAVFCGSNSYFNGLTHIICSEQRSVIMGSDCLLSFGVWMRTADPHLVYDANTKARLNPSDDIVVGDHVWIGQDAMLLKGTRLGSGSILGAKALISKVAPSNTSWGGVPARCLKESIFWDGRCVHAWGEEQTQASMTYDREPAIFQPDADTLDLDQFLSRLYEVKDPHSKLEIIQSQLMEKSANRLAIGREAQRGTRASSSATKAKPFSARLFHR